MGQSIQSHSRQCWRCLLAFGCLTVPSYRQVSGEGSDVHSEGRLAAFPVESCCFTLYECWHRELDLDV